MLKTRILITLMISILFIGCNKEENNNEPVTLPVSNNQGNKVQMNGILPNGASSGGFVYSTNSGFNPESASEVLGSISGGDTITATTFVDPNTNYFVKAYAWVDGDRIYGNEISFATGYAVGETHEGGIIGYIFQPQDPGYIEGEQHGLIFAENELGTDVQWGCEGTSVSGTNLEIGSGANNTSQIVSQCSDNGIAARLCDQLSVNGYSDWFLPSYSELRAIDENIEQLDITIGYYFSSSQASANNAWAIYLWPPPVVEGPSEYAKSQGRRVLAVRYF
jgi:hypothetical protein